jgi:hypothetical protein
MVLVHSLISSFIAYMKVYSLFANIIILIIFYTWAKVKREKSCT